MERLSFEQALDCSTKIPSGTTFCLIVQHAFRQEPSCKPHLHAPEWEWLGLQFQYPAGNCRFRMEFAAVVATRSQLVLRQRISSPSSTLIRLPHRSLLDKIPDTFQPCYGRDLVL